MIDWEGLDVTAVAAAAQLRRSAGKCGAVLTMTKILSVCLSVLTLAGFAAIVLAIFLRYKEVGSPTPIILLSSGAATFLLAGVPWAHTQGSRGPKAAVLGLVGCAAGGIAGFFFGYAIAPKRPDDMSPLLFGFAGIWLGGIIFAFLFVRWAVRFHRRYAVKPVVREAHGNGN